ncbi:MAG: PilZ domain-containing protein [Vicinamibacteria bacterium]|nr:PilZ domain-containing protein [Vicinamibacteria bacterium]
MAESKAEAAVAESNRRVDARYPAAAIPAITAMRLSPGEAVALVNISASGVLVEGKTRFVPGTRVTVHFEGAIKPNQIKARVIRCQVSAIGSGGSLQYQSAIAFDGRMELPVEESALPPPAVASSAPPEDPAPKKGKAAAIPPPAAPAPPRVYNRW